MAETTATHSSTAWRLPEARAPGEGAPRAPGHPLHSLAGGLGPQVSVRGCHAAIFSLPVSKIPSS